MKKLTFWSRLITSPSVKFLVLLVVFFASMAANASEASRSSANVKIIELFTSHGCSSCPPAEKLLGELLESDPDLLALEFHVDYWNNLVHGRDGNFVDPFSNSKYSMRQREYSAAKLAGRPGVYTPQAVVNGRIAAVGSNRRHITKALSMPSEAAFVITQQPLGSDPSVLRISVEGTQERLQQLSGTDITLVRYMDSAVTKITGGENRNLKLLNHNIVFEVTRLGQVNAGAEMVYSIAAPRQGEGCVVLVQEGALTPVFAALECP
ncbi:MAG: DUF1223 domain-containing protein [Granulosicoccus sp.]